MHMAARVQKAPIIVLPMEFNQLFREAAQHVARGPAIIDPRRFAPVRVVHPAQDQLAIIRVNPKLIQKRTRVMACGQIEDSRHLALRGARTHQIGTPAPAKHKAKTVEQDRFTRPRFPGEHVEPRMKIEREPINDQHVADIKMPQHPHSPLRDPC